MLDCQTCIHKAENTGDTNKRHAKGMMKPKKKYCSNGCFKELTFSALKGYSYPVWCPLNTCKKTCIECGTRIREEEGDYCQKHK